MLLLDAHQMDLFPEVPEDSFIPNQAVSSLDILLPSLLYLMHTSDKDLNTLTLYALKILLT